MLDRRAGGIVAAVTLTIAAAFVAIALLIVHTSVDTAAQQAQNSIDLYAGEVAAEVEAHIRRQLGLSPAGKIHASFTEILEDEESSSQAEEGVPTLRELIEGMWGDDRPETLFFNDAGTVVLSCGEADSEGTSVWERHPELSEAIGAVQSGEAASKSVWVGLEGILPRGQMLYEVRRCNIRDTYLLVYSAEETYFAPMRSRLTTLVLALVVVMVMLLLLVMLIVRWYRARLMKAATTDELTGLANRKWFASSYQALLDEGVEEAHLVLIDVDKFKSINDTYGHASGDKALAAVAREVDAMVGERGIAGRWGGDEFIAVLNMGSAEARERAQSLVDVVAAQPVEGTIPVSVSVGLAQIDGDGSLERAVEHADDALYVVKEGGRGFLTVYEEGITPHMSDDAQEASAPSEPRGGQAAPEATKAAGATKELRGKSEIRSVAGMRLSVDLVVRSLLEAVSKMVPFVAGGGILIALAFLIDGASVDVNALGADARASFGSITPLAAGLKDVGSAAFNFMLPVFAAFFARGLAGDEAFMAGFAGGFLSSQGSAGFAGAIASAIVAAVVVNLMRGVLGDTGKRLQRVAPVLLYPVFSLLIMYLLMNFLIDPAATAFDGWLTSMLEACASGSRVALGALCGAMMATDMGGPINKAAYHFGTAAIASGSPDIMAAVMVGGMVPPCGIAICMLLYPDLFSEAENDQGPATFFMGLSFITEGALPFVLTDPIRTIASCMAGSALAGALSVMSGCTLMAPHGGIFVFPVVGNPVSYVLALVGGTLVCAIMLGFVKRLPAPKGMRVRESGRDAR